MSTHLDPPPRPEGHRAAAWLAAAGGVGLACGLLLLSATDIVAPESALQSIESAAAAARSEVGDAGDDRLGGLYLELPDGALRRVQPNAALPLLALEDELDRPAVGTCSRSCW